MILNSKRELAYVTKIDSIEQIVGSDNCEAAVIGGWKVMVRKGEFKEGDKVVYFETDSKLPEEERFSFLEKKHYKIKIQRYTFGGKGLFYSQGLVMSFEDLKLDSSKYDLLQPMTTELGVMYAIADDNKRKASSIDIACQSMMARHKKIFKNPCVKKIMKFELGRKVMFLLFGRKSDKPLAFPSKFPFISKTDEERVENMTWVLEDKSPLVVTEKLDGTSCTYILEKKSFGRYEFYVTSRNVRQLDPRQETYFNQVDKVSGNIYWDLAFKYDIENKLKEYLNTNKLKYVCIQGEGVGSPQDNPLKLKENDLYVFNFIRSDVGRISSIEGKEIIESMGMKFVPILDTNFILPDSMEEFKLMADGNSVVNHNVLREGLVLRNPETGLSFKNVSRLYLLNKK